jgi:outer membrane protein TolC
MITLLQVLHRVALQFGVLPLLLIFSVNLTSAQEELTLEQTWSVAIRNNYTLQQQELLIEKAQEEIAVQRTDYYPSLSTSALLARTNFNQLPLDVPNASGKVGLDLVSVSISQPIFSGFRTKYMVVSAEEQLKAQQIQKKTLFNSVLLQVGNLYYELQSNILQQDVLRSSTKRIQNQLTRMQNLYASEQATPFDTLEISNKKLQVENQLAILEDAYRILLSKMKYLLNADEPLKIRKISPALTQFKLGTIEGYIQSALRNRPEIQTLSAQKQAQIAYSNVLQSHFYPMLSASLGFNYLKPNGDILKNEWINFYSVLVNFSWELWNWKRDKRKVQQARLDLDRLNIQENQIIRDIRHQTEVAYQNLLSSRKRIQLQSRLLAQEKERFEITEKRFQQGLATFLDLDSSELALTEAEVELHTNYMQWLKSELQLDFATGEISKKFVEVTDE